MTDVPPPGSSPRRARTTLSGISSRAWEHPSDRGALIAMRKLKGFDSLLRNVSAMVSERGLRLELRGSAVRVDERQFARLHRLLVEACTTLDAPAVPDMYVVAHPTLNAVCLGMKQPTIVLHSAVVDLLDEEELRFVIAHELGHALSGHAVYQTMLEWAIGMSSLLSGIPIGGVAFRLIESALLEWSRKAELSADRAGLLATQDPQSAVRVHMQMASGGHLADLDTTSFLEQGAAYEEDGDLRESFLKLRFLAQDTHPFAVLRATELRRWVDSGEYTRFLAGDYPRREDDADASVTDAAKEAAAGYATAFARTGDALGRLVHSSAGVLGDLVGKWGDWRRG